MQPCPSRPRATLHRATSPRGPLASGRGQRLPGETPGAGLYQTGRWADHSRLVSPTRLPGFRGDSRLDPRTERRGPRSGGRSRRRRPGRGRGRAGRRDRPSRGTGSSVHRPPTSRAPRSGRLWAGGAGAHGGRLRRRRRAPPRASIRCDPRHFRPDLAWECCRCHDSCTPPLPEIRRRGADGSGERRAARREEVSGPAHRAGLSSFRRRAVPGGAGGSALPRPRRRQKWTFGPCRGSASRR